MNDEKRAFVQAQRNDEKKPYTPPSYERALAQAQRGVGVDRSPLIDDGRVVRPNAVEVAGTSPRKSISTLNEVRDFAGSLIESAGAVAAHLEELACVLSGVVPEPENMVAHDTPPAGILESIWTRLKALDALIARMNRTASHIRSTIA